MIFHEGILSIGVRPLLVDFHATPEIAKFLLFRVLIITGTPEQGSPASLRSDLDNDFLFIKPGFNLRSILEGCPGKNPFQSLWFPKD